MGQRFSRGDRPAQRPAVGCDGAQDLGRQRTGAALELQQQGLQLEPTHFWYWPNWAS